MRAAGGDEMHVGDPVDQHGRRAIASRAVAKLAVPIATPAGDPARGKCNAGVRGPRAHRRRGADSGDRHGHRACGVAAVAELADAAGAPADDAARSQQRAGEPRPRSDPGDARQGRAAGRNQDRSRRGAADPGSVTELALRVGAPALDATADDGTGVVRPDRDRGGDHRLHAGRADRSLERERGTRSRGRAGDPEQCDTRRGKRDHRAAEPRPPDHRLDLSPRRRHPAAVSRCPAGPPRAGWRQPWRGRRGAITNGGSRPRQVRIGRVAPARSIMAWATSPRAAFVARGLARGAGGSSRRPGSSR